MDVPTMPFFTFLLTLLHTGVSLIAAAPVEGAALSSVVEQATNSISAKASCFPALGFQMPKSLPSSTDGWWCDPSTEYAFLGFSYEVTACK